MKVSEVLRKYSKDNGYLKFDILEIRKIKSQTIIYSECVVRDTSDTIELLKEDFGDPVVEQVTNDLRKGKNGNESVIILNILDIVEPTEIKFKRKSLYIKFNNGIEYTTPIINGAVDVSRFGQEYAIIPQYSEETCYQFRDDFSTISDAYYMLANGYCDTIAVSFNQGWCSYRCIVYKNRVHGKSVAEHAIKTMPNIYTSYVIKDGLYVCTNNNMEIVYREMYEPFGEGITPICATHRLTSDLKAIDRNHKIDKAMIDYAISLINIGYGSKTDCYVTDYSMGINEVLG